MPNLTTILRAEITRIARRELKSECESLKKSNSRYRSEIADLKRRISLLEQLLKAAERQARKQVSQAAVVAEPTKIRFRADGLKKHRERLGLSAPVLASILGVSPQSVYNWEVGTSRPNREMVERIAILRKMGKREVQERLAAMKSA